MKKRMISVLAALMIVLAIVPAFAAPTCPIDGCAMGIKRLNERKSSLAHLQEEAYWYDMDWDTANDCWIVRCYKSVHMTCDVYYVCSHDSSHKSFIRTEQYIKTICTKTFTMPRE